MKRKFFAILCLCLCLMSTTVTAFAENNHKDSALPQKFIAYTTYANTPLRSKTDDSSVYINNTSGMDLWVYIKSNTNKNCTYDGHAIVKSGEWLMHNTVYEGGFSTCYLNISAAKSGVSGTLKGLWSPDSVGSYPYANPFRTYR